MSKQNIQNMVSRVFKKKKYWYMILINPQITTELWHSNNIDPNSAVFVSSSWLY